MRHWLGLVAGCALLGGSGALAQAPASTTPAAAPIRPDEAAPRIPATAFASQDIFSSVRLSPNGNLMAVRATVNAQVQIVILDVVTRKQVHRIVVNAKDQLQWFRWAGNERMLLSISTVGAFFDTEVLYTRLYLMDFKTNALTFVGKKDEGPEGDDVLYVDPLGRYILLSIQRTVYDYPSVWRFSLEPQPAKPGMVQAPRNGIWEWFADDAGTVRMGFEASGSKLKVWYRKLAADELKLVVKLGEDDLDDKIWDIARIFSGQDEGFILEKAGNTVALRKFNYATRSSGDIVYQNPEWDVTEAIIGRDGKPSAAYFTDDKDRVEWLDPAMKTLQKRLEKAMPGMDLWVVSRAEDDSRMLISAGHEDDPGALFLYTAAKRSLEYLADYRPAIKPSQLARPKPVSYVARDKTLIHAYLTLPRGHDAKRLPLIILPHGGPYGIRDKLEYNSEVQFLANRGYAVLQPNYRGSGGYGEPFGELGRGEIGRKMQDDIDDAMDWAVKQGIADAARVCVVGSSYGGYAALWAVIRNPERYRCAASFAGVTDWKKQLSYDADFFSRTGARKWRTQVVGEDSAFDLDTVSPARQVARLTRPVLLAHGDDDTNVPFSQYKRMRDAAAQAKVPLELLVFADEGHGFGKPEDEQRWYEALEAFLTKNNPAD
jgi:dipeptidyl aminopeptidase/acylaminoacyl peptidase